MRWRDWQVWYVGLISFVAAWYQVDGRSNTWKCNKMGVLTFIRMYCFRGNVLPIICWSTSIYSLYKSYTKTSLTYTQFRFASDSCWAASPMISITPAVSVRYYNNVCFRWNIISTIHIAIYYFTHYKWHIDDEILAGYGALVSNTVTDMWQWT